jgi:hypothetical protein
MWGAIRCILERKRHGYGVLTFQPGSGQWSGDTCVMWRCGNGSIGEHPWSAKWPSRTESKGPPSQRTQCSQDSGPRLPGGIRESPECYPSWPETHERSSLAHCEPVMLVTAPNVEQPQVQDTAPKLQDVVAASRQNLSDAESWELEELLSTETSFAMKSDDYGWANSVPSYTYGKDSTDSLTP